MNPRSLMHLARTLGAAAALLANAAAHAQDQPPVQVSEGPHKLSVAADGSSSVRVPLVLGPDTAVEDLRITEVYVTSGDGRVVTGTLSANLVGGGAQVLPSLQLSATAADLSFRPGSYTVSLQVQRQARDGRAASPPQRILLSLARPAPRLAAVDPVIVGHTASLITQGGTVAGHLRLAEDSRTAPIRALQVSESREAPPAGALPASAALRITPITPGHAGLEPGTAWAARVDIDGTFPYGVSKGRIELRSPDLDAMVAVPYEVRSRRSPDWIVLIATVGALCGWALRSQLRPRRDNALAQAAASPLVGALKSARDRIADGPFREGVDRLLEGLRLAVEDADAPRLLTHVAEGRTELGRLEKDLAERRTQLVNAYRPLDGAVRRPYDLPQAVATCLDDARTAMRAVGAAIDRHDVTGAQASLASLARRELRQTLQAAEDWRLAMARYLGAVAESRPPVGAEQLQAWHEAVTATVAAPMAVANAGEVSADDLESGLVDLHRRRQTLRSQLHVLQRHNEAFTVASLTRLKAGEAHAAAIHHGLEALWTPMPTEVDTPVAADDAWRRRAAAVREAWLNALTAAPGRMDRHVLETMLDKGQWAEAVAKAAQPIDIPAGGRSQSTAEAGAAAGSDDLGAVAADSDAPGAAVGGGSTYPALPLTGSIQERRDLLAAARRAEGWQSVIVALLFIAGVYALYLDAWVGTPKEMLALLLLALGVDLSADNVLAALKKPGGG